MKNKKLLTLIGSVCLILVLAALPFMAACPAPLGEETTKPPATTAPPPTTTAPPAKPIELEIYSNPLGSTGYVLSFALAEIINKYSDKYHATCVESKGLTVNMLYLIKYPEARKNTIIFVNNIGVGEAEMGMPPFEEPYLDFRYVSLTANMNIFMVSTSPDITKVEDMVGKRVAVGAKGHSTEYTMRLVLDYGYGVWDKLKTSYLDMSAAKDALWTEQ